MVQAGGTRATRRGSARAGAAGQATLDSGAQGPGLRRMHEEVLAPIVWLALGCTLGWQNKLCYTAHNEIVVLPCVGRLPPQGEYRAGHEARH